MTKKFSFIIICSVVALCIGFIAGQLVEIPGFPVENLSSNISKANRYKKGLGLNQTRVIADKLMADSAFYQQTMQVLGIMSLKADASSANAELAMEIIKKDPALAQTMEAELMALFRDAERTKALANQAIEAIQDVVESGKITANLEEMISKSYLSFIKQDKELFRMMPHALNSFRSIPVFADDPRTPALLSAVAFDAMTSAVLSNDAEMADAAILLLAENYREGCLKDIRNEDNNNVALFSSWNSGLILRVVMAAAENKELLQINEALAMFPIPAFVPEASAALDNNLSEGALSYSPAPPFMQFSEIQDEFGLILKELLNEERDQSQTLGLNRYQSEYKVGDYNLADAFNNKMLPHIFYDFEGAVFTTINLHTNLTMLPSPW